MFFDIILGDYLFDVALNSPNEGELFLAFLAFLRSVANSTFEELLHIAFTSFVKFLTVVHALSSKMTTRADVRI